MNDLLSYLGSDELVFYMPWHKATSLPYRCSAMCISCLWI